MLSRRNHVKVEFWKDKSARDMGWSSGERDICVGMNCQRKPGLEAGKAQIKVLADSISADSSLLALYLMLSITVVLLLLSHFSRS